ncbi:MAG: hypothetical protein ACRYFK_20500, partial [Janthinobacterium lividum]
MRLFLPATLLLAGLLTGLPHQSQAQVQAQVVDAAPRPGRYYLGLGGTVGRYAQGRNGGASVLAPALSGGLRLMPRLALELSLQVGWSSRSGQEAKIGVAAGRLQIGGASGSPGQ